MKNTDRKLDLRKLRSRITAVILAALMITAMPNLSGKNPPARAAGLQITLGGLRAKVIANVELQGDEFILGIHLLGTGVQNSEYEPYICG